MTSRWEIWKTWICLTCCALWQSGCTLHKKWNFPSRISSVNVTKFAVSCELGHICWRNLQWKTSFFVQWQILRSLKECFDQYSLLIWIHMVTGNEKLCKLLFKKLFLQNVLALIDLFIDIIISVILHRPE